jgi:hypothetical protein
MMRLTTKGVDFNKNLLTSSSRTDPRATPEDKQEQTNRGPSASKRHGSPKGAEDPKRTKVEGYGQGSSSQQKKTSGEKEICEADQRGKCRDKNCPKLHLDERFVDDA